MTNPTPTPTTPAAPARSARETIAEAVKAVEEWAHPYTPAEAALRDGYNTLFRKICGTHAALRALLDAPTSAVERLVKAARDIDETLRADAMPNDAAHLALVDALAAVRASPEAVGAGASDLDTEKENLLHRLEKVTAERDDAHATLEDVRAGLGVGPRFCVCDAVKRLVAERDTLKTSLAWTSKALDESRGLGYLTRAEKAEKERDALKADFEKARGEVERVTAVLVQTAKDRDAAHKARCEANDIARANADERNRAVGELMRLRADRDRAAMPTTANASAPPPPAPQPASEGAAISERARLLYEGAMHYIATTAAAGLQDGPEDCARIARRVLEECEKAGKGEGGKA